MNTGTSKQSYAGLLAAANLSKLAAEESSDAELIERIAAADDLAMQVLYRRHHDSVFRFVYRIVGLRHAAEDIANDVFLEVWRNASAFEQRSGVSTWLLAIARNKSLSERRSRKSEPWDEDAMALIEDESDGPEATVEKRDAGAILHRCLDQLSPAHRAVIDLVYFHHKSTTEAAKVVGSGCATVKTRLFYARERLSELLSDQGVVAGTA
jgi:RNA polymerase sigma-70 factor (ECF subfamily)